MKNGNNYTRYASSITYNICAKESDYLYVTESQIRNSGKGLFTSIDIYKNEIIAIFRGQILSSKEALEMASKNSGSYFINLPDGNTMDSYKSRCFAKYANDANGFTKTYYKNNSKISISDNGKICIVACRKILAGEEIFCSYGSKYWKRYETRMSKT